MKTTPLLAVLSLALATAALHAQLPAASTNALAQARVFHYEQTPARVSPNGAEGRNLFNGTLATGESVGAHATVQPAGTVPGPIHTIQHSEVIVIVEGTVTFDHDGQTDTAGPGSVLYVMPGTQHRLRNMSTAPVKYVVVQVGGDTKK
jgi:mannose-6-phosphate isomerase-like protein (cupin superfamily)